MNSAWLLRNYELWILTLKLYIYIYIFGFGFGFMKAYTWLRVCLGRVELSSLFIYLFPELLFWFLISKQRVGLFVLCYLIIQTLFFCWENDRIATSAFFFSTESMYLTESIGIVCLSSGGSSFSFVFSTAKQRVRLLVVGNC